MKKEKLEAFRKAAEPLVKYLCENHHPHTYVVVEPTGAELLEGSARVKIEEFILD